MTASPGSLLIVGARSESGRIDVEIRGGLVARVAPHEAAPHRSAGGPEGLPVIHATCLLALPGIIDPHVHVRDLGQRHKETWHTASAAACAGGITTLFDMPNTVPPTTGASGLAIKRAAAATLPAPGAGGVRRRFYLGAAPGNVASLHAILAHRPADVVGIKLYMAGSSGNDTVEDPGEMAAFFALAAEHGVVIAVHAEDQETIRKAARAAKPGAARPGAADHGMLRPPRAAAVAVERALRVAADTGARLYLCHVSTGEELDLIRAARGSLSVYCEATPHHLFLDESITSRLGNLAKVNPPLRSAAHRERLLEALADGTISTIGSDHAPHAIREKRSPYASAPSGFPGLETLAGVVMTLHRRGVINLAQVVDLTSRNAAAIFGLAGQGDIVAGAFGDVTLIDPEREWTVDPDAFRSKARYSPFAGMRLCGRVVQTIIAGNPQEEAWIEGNGCSRSSRSEPSRSVSSR